MDTLLRTSAPSFLPFFPSFLFFLPSHTSAYSLWTNCFKSGSLTSTCLLAWTTGQVGGEIGSLSHCRGRVGGQAAGRQASGWGGRQKSRQAGGKHEEREVGDEEADRVGWRGGGGEECSECTAGR